MGGDISENSEIGTYTSVLVGIAWCFCLLVAVQLLIVIALSLLEVGGFGGLFRALIYGVYLLTRY